MANAMQQWQAKATETLAVANDLINRLPYMMNLYTANDLESLIAGTPDGEIVPGGTLAKARVLELTACFDSFYAWLNTPVTEGAPAPIIIINRVD